MPTITLSWTDLALFGLTASLIGGVVLVGRATASTSQPDKSSSKQASAGNSTKKKKNKSKKGASAAESDPAAASPTSDHSNPLPRSLPLPEQPRPLNPAHELSPRPANDRSSKRKIHSETQPLQTVKDSEFPPLSTLKDDPSAVKPKSNPKRPLAERRQPPVRKTIVDDMIDEEVEKPPKMARVMTIVDPESESPEAPESELEDGWEKVPDSKKSRATGISISIGSSPRPPASTSAAQSAQALSKRQRQNAKKKEAAKAIKAVEEAERIGRLSSHKRQQERVRMNSQANTPKSNDASAQKPKSQVTGGGMKAVIGEDGRLIWE